MRPFVCIALLLVACGGAPPKARGRVEISGAPSAAGVVVRVLTGQGGSAVTLDDGAFDFEPGAAVLLTAEDVRPPSVTLARAEDGVTVHFTAVGTVVGTARRGGAAKGNGQVAVALVGSEAHTTAGDSGAFELQVPAGPAVLSARAPGYGEAVSAPLTIGRGARVTVPPLILPLVGFGFSGALSGRVARIGAPDHAGVEVLVEGAGRTAVTDAAGRFMLEGVPEGSYTLVFSYSGLTERVPNVVVTRGADGFIVDQALYRLGDKPISLMAATRIDSGRMALSPVRPPYATWVAWDLAQTQARVHWAVASRDEARDAGRILAWYNWERTSPTLSPDGAWVVWAPNDGTLKATSTATGASSVIGTNYRRPVGWDGARQYCPVSAGGLVAYEGYADGNRDALMLTHLPGDAPPPRVLRQWPGPTSAVYGARFYGEALVAMTDVVEYAGVLRWWKGDEPERTLTASGYASNFASGDARGRYHELPDRWYSNYSVFDLEEGTRIHTHAQGQAGLFSADLKSYAWTDGAVTKVLDLPTLAETKVTDRPNFYRACVVGHTVVGTTSSGELLAVSPSASVTLAPAPPADVHRQSVSCAGGCVYWTEYTQPDYQRLTLFEAPMAGGPARVLGTGNLSGSALEVRAGRVWFVTGSRNLNSATYGTLWVARQGEGDPAVVLDDVRVYPRMLVPSPDGTRLAAIALDGLYVLDAADPRPRRLATGVDDVQWLSNTQLVFTVPPPTAPFSFQGGVYFARPAGGGT